MEYTRGWTHQPSYSASLHSLRDTGSLVDVYKPWYPANSFGTSADATQDLFFEPDIESRRDSSKNSHNNFWTFPGASTRQPPPAKPAFEVPTLLNDVSFMSPPTAQFRLSFKRMGPESWRSAYAPPSTCHENENGDLHLLLDLPTAIDVAPERPSHMLIDLSSEISRSELTWETLDYGAFRGIFTEPVIPVKISCHKTEVSVQQFLDPSLPHEELSQHRARDSIHMDNFFRATLLKVNKVPVQQPSPPPMSPYRRRPPQTSSGHQPKTMRIHQ